jgi:hypothetical protein
MLASVQDLQYLELQEREVRKGMTDNLEVRATLRYTTTRGFQRLLFVDGLVAHEGVGM